MLEGLRRLKEEGIEVIVFGDIFLEDLRAFRDRQRFTGQTLAERDRALPRDKRKEPPTP